MCEMPEFDGCRGTRRMASLMDQKGIRGFVMVRTAFVIAAAVAGLSFSAAAASAAVVRPVPGVPKAQSVSRTATIPVQQ